MTKPLKVHVVMSDAQQMVVEEISRQCQVTCWNRLLAEVAAWAESGAGEEPHILLISSSDYLGSPKSVDRQTKKFLLTLKGIRQKRQRARIVILIPLDYLGNLELVSELIKLRIYDLWFLEDFDEKDIYDFLNTRRDKAGLEAYIKAREKEFWLRGKAEPKIGTLAEKIFQPYYLKPNVLAFYSTEDTHINTGLAILTALNLAQLGFKVALVESITHLTQLAPAMSVPHPFFNTSHALTMYELGNNGFLRNCMFNSARYVRDSYVTEQNEHVQYYPESLYFLPDKVGGERLASQGSRPKWQDFFFELTRVTMFERDFHFLIYLCNGWSEINKLIINKMAYLQFITVNLLPGSVVNAVDELFLEQGDLYLVASGYTDFLAKELKGLGSKQPLYCPDSFRADLLKYLYFKNYSAIGSQTQEFINRILEITGVRLSKESLHGNRLWSHLQYWKERLWG